MYIKMNDDKSLIITVPTTIYRGEKNADLITFLVPSYYNGKNIADCAATLRYILPSGSGRSESLNYLPEMYKNYLQFSTIVNPRFTEERGDVTMWLTFYDDDNVILKSGEVNIPISQSKDIGAYLPPEDLDQIYQLAKRVDAFENEKADSMVYNYEENTLQLTANGNPIGALIDMDAVVDDANEVILFGTEPVTPDDSDDVIYF